jgi:hypothetical protein
MTRVMSRRRATVTGDQIERIAAGPVITGQAGSRPRPRPWAFAHQP